MPQNAKGCLSACTQMKDAKMRHFPFHDDRTATYVFGHGGRSHFPAFANATNAKGCMIADTGLGHIEITLLKNPQRELRTGIKHGIEREYWQNIHFGCEARGAKIFNCRDVIRPNAASRRARRLSGPECVQRRNRRALARYAADDKKRDWPGE